MLSAQDIARHAGLVDEHVTARIVHEQRIQRPTPRGGDISAVLFVGEYCFLNAEAQAIDLAPERTQANRHAKPVADFF